MGTVTKTIGSGGGRDYSTPQAWADALPADLVSDGNSQVGNFYADSEFNFSTSFGALLTLSGHTTDAAHTITFQAAPGQSHIDNAGVQANAFRYDPSNGAALKVTGAYSKLVTGNDEVYVKRLQLANYGSGNSNEVFSNTLFGGTLHLSQLIVESSTPSARGSSLTNGAAANCIFIQRSNIPAVYTEYHSFAFVNCGFVSPSDIGNTHAAVHDNGNPSPSFVNCCFFGFSGGVVDGGGSPSGNHNATDRSSIGFGSDNLTSLIFSDQFQNVSNATRDFRLKSGAGLIDAGQAVGTDGVPSADAVGTPRPQGAVPDIGPWELVQASELTLSGSTTETPDSSAAPARVALRASANLAPARDAAVLAVRATISGTGAIGERADAFAGSETTARRGMGAAAESTDRATVLGKTGIAACAALQISGDAGRGTARTAISIASAGTESDDAAEASVAQIVPFVLDPQFLITARPRLRAAAPDARLRRLGAPPRVRTVIPIKRV